VNPAELPHRLACFLINNIEASSQGLALATAAICWEINIRLQMAYQVPNTESELRNSPEVADVPSPGESSGRSYLQDSDYIDDAARTPSRQLSPAEYTSPSTRSNTRTTKISHRTKEALAALYPLLYDTPMPHCVLSINDAPAALIVAHIIARAAPHDLVSSGLLN
jgi:hypothetical protein